MTNRDTRLRITLVLASGPALLVSACTLHLARLGEHNGFFVETRPLESLFAPDDAEDRALDQKLRLALDSTGLGGFIARLAGDRSCNPIIPDFGLHCPLMHFSCLADDGAPPWESGSHDAGALRWTHLQTT